MSEIKVAAETLRHGGVVAFPTETVYGLGADACNDDAVRRVFSIKGRPADHPLIVHIGAADQVEQWASTISETARSLMAHFWPGPLTLVLPARNDVSRVITGGQDSVALRVPNHPVALELLQAFNGGLVAPSANRFGAVSPTTAKHVRSSLGDQVDLVLDGGPCHFGLESTIVSLLDERPRVLRPGALSLAALHVVLGRDGIEYSERPATLPRVPGALAQHYAPSTALEIIAGNMLATTAGELLAQGLRVAVLRHHAGPLDLPLTAQLYFLPPDPVGYAHGLYACLRELDELTYDHILVEAPPQEEAWWAVNDRLSRASSGSRKTDGK